jgi:hypothetical protein
MENELDKQWPDVAKFRLNEYGKLRDEVVKRIELQQHVLFIIIAIFGGFIAAALPNVASSVPPIMRASTLMMYPLCASVLTNVWVRHHLTVLDIAHHVAEIEKQLKIFGWEHRHVNKWVNVVGNISVFAVLFFTQVAMIGLGLLWLGGGDKPELADPFAYGWLMTTLFILDIFSLIWTVGWMVYALCHVRPDYRMQANLGSDSTQPDAADHAQLVTAR